MRLILMTLLAGCRPTLALQAFTDEAVELEGKRCVWAVIESASPIRPTDSLYLCCAEAGTEPVCTEAAWTRTEQGIEIGGR